MISVLTPHGEFAAGTAARLARGELFGLTVVPVSGWRKAYGFQQKVMREFRRFRTTKTRGGEPACAMCV